MREAKFSKTLPDDARMIRETVFIKEQGFRNEFDDLDSISLHLVVYENGVPTATGRLIPNAGIFIAGRIAVLPEFRGAHLGSYVLLQLENKARDLGAREITLSAQCRARGFYEKLGYTAYNDEHLDEFCPHVDMKKSLINS